MNLRVVCAVVLISLASSGAHAGILARSDTPPDGFEPEIEVQHPTGSNERRCYLRENAIEAELTRCEAEVTNTVTLIFEGFWQDRETTVQITEPGGQTHEFSAVNGAIFKLLMVPGKQVGLYEVEARQRGGTRKGSFVLQRANAPTVSVRNGRVVAGDSVEYMLSGFAADQEIRLFLYRANGVTSYDGIGKSYFDYVTQLGNVTTDDGGETMVRIETDSADPTGHYVLMTDPVADAGEAAANQFWLSGGTRAPRAKRFRETSEQLTESQTAPPAADEAKQEQGTQLPPQVATVAAALQLEPNDTPVPSVSADEAKIANANVELAETASADSAQVVAGEQAPAVTPVSPSAAEADAAEVALPGSADVDNLEATITAEEAAGLKSELDAVLAKANLPENSSAGGALEADGLAAVADQTTRAQASSSDAAQAAADSADVAVVEVIQPATQSTSAQFSDEEQRAEQVCADAVVRDVSALSLRDAPGFNTNKIGFVSKDALVEVLCTEREFMDDRTWFEVRTSLGAKGWMSGKYLNVLREYGVPEDVVEGSQETAAQEVIQPETVELVTAAEDQASEPQVEEVQVSEDVSAAAAIEETSVTTSDGEESRGCGFASVVEVASLAVRAEPAINAELRGALVLDETAELMCVEPVDTETRTWVKVRAESGLEGWMSTRFLRIWD